MGVVPPTAPTRTHPNPRYGKRMHQIPHRGFLKTGIVFARQGKGHLRNLAHAHLHRQGILALSPHFFSLLALRKCLVVRSARGSGGSVDPAAPAVRRCQGFLSLGAPSSASHPPSLPTTLSSARSIPHCHSTCCLARVALLVLVAPLVWPRLAVARNDSALPSPSTIPAARNDVALEISYPASPRQSMAPREDPG